VLLYAFGGNHPTVEQLILIFHWGLTDVGSVKAPVVEAIAPLAQFIDGHPMAGTADSGIEAAVPDLFALKPYVLTPVATTPAQAVKTVEKIAQSLEPLYIIVKMTTTGSEAGYLILPVMSVLG